MHFPDVLDFLFPHYCLGCGVGVAGGAVICRPCETRLPLHHTFFCAVCEAPIETLGKSCHENTPYHVGAASSYDHPLLQELIHALKFNGIRSAAVPLGALLTRYLELLHCDMGNPLVIPIPLHHNRERLRGFNQSELIAHHVANHCGFELASKALIRTRDTPPQRELERHDRLRNLQECFTVRASAAVMDRVVILIDDVTTSGATFREAAQTCSHFGARSVIALAVAKA